jgi:recombination protein RecA
MKQWLRMFSGTIKRTGSLVIFVHQVSSKIDAYAKDTETFMGGNALQHASHLDLRLKYMGQELEGNELVGRKVKAIINKSKQGNAFRTFQYVIRSDCGPDNVGAVYDAALQLKIIKASGSWVTIPGIEKPIQGKNNVRQFWLDNPSEFRHVEKMVLEAAEVNTLIGTEEPDEESD